MFRAWIRLSALWASLASFSKKDKAVLSRTVSSGRFSTPFFLFQLLFALMIPGSARKIAIIAGGIPADLLNTVLWDSLEILSSVLSSICLGKWANKGCTKSFEIRISNVSRVISIAPLCLNWKSIPRKFSQRFSTSSFWSRLPLSVSDWGSSAHLNKFCCVSPFSFTASHIPTRIKFS